MKHDRLIKNEKTLCFVEDHYEQYTLKFNELAESVLMNSIENSVSADFIDEFDRSFSASTTNQSISIGNDSENENAAFYA